jgi:hypothetical protein
MTGAPVAPPEGFPPLRRDYRVHGWIFSAGVSQIGDMAWYAASHGARPR